MSTTAPPIWRSNSRFRPSAKKSCNPPIKAVIPNRFSDEEPAFRPQLAEPTYPRQAAENLHSIKLASAKISQFDYHLEPVPRRIRRQTRAQPHPESGSFLQSSFRPPKEAPHSRRGNCSFDFAPCRNRD